MSLVTYKNELIIALNRKLVSISIADPKVTKYVELSSEIAPKTESDPTGPEASETEPPAPKTKVNEVLKKIQQIKVSPNGEFLAATTAGRKMLLLYKIHSETIEFLSARRIARASSGLAFSDDSSKILVCDKTGDCYMFDCHAYDTPGKWILGHLSMVLDVLFAPNQAGIVTSDRDEKIRVTNFPATHDIECYCLGHSEYVSSIAFLPSDPCQFLVSLSGDRTLKVWKYLLGQRVHEISLPAPGIKLAVRQVDESVSHVAVLVYQPDESLFIYRLRHFESKIESSMLSSHSFDGKIITDLGFSNDVLYLTTSADGRLGLEALQHENEAYHSVDSKAINELLRSVFQGEEITDLEDVSGWFKKKFDNLTEYLERKKRRIDEKQAKSNSILCN